MRGGRDASAARERSPGVGGRIASRTLVRASDALPARALLLPYRCVAGRDAARSRSRATLRVAPGPLRWPGKFAHFRRKPLPQARRQATASSVRDGDALDVDGPG